MTFAPEGHASQFVRPEVAAKVPGVQALQALSLSVADRKNPGRQGRHVVLLSGKADSVAVHWERPTFCRAAASKPGGHSVNAV